MNSQEITDAEDTRKKFEERSSQRSSDADEPMQSAPEKPMPVKKHITEVVKTLRKVKRIKIEEQISSSNRTVILERCKNLETCPASKQAMEVGGKLRPHFHKVYVNNAEKTRPSTSGTLTQPSNARKSDDSNSGSEQRKVDQCLEESCQDTANAELRDEKPTEVDIKPSYRLEKIHINLSKALPKKEESSTFSRYSGELEQEDMMSNWQAIQDARAETILGQVPDNIRKKYQSTAEFLAEYYKTKDERSFDRCAYVNCKKGRFTTGAHLFRFPQITDPRLITWIKNSGNPRMLYWSWSTIRRAGICGDHFTDDSFYNETRQRLLRTACPKPFYLETHLFADDEKDVNLSMDDLRKIFHIIEKGAEELTDPVLIDLPNEKFENGENLKIRYPFEDPELTETDNIAESSNSAGRGKEESYESFASVMLKTETTDQAEDDEDVQVLCTTSGLTDTKDVLIKEIEEDPLGDASATNGNDFEQDSEEVGNIKNILVLQQRKVRLCKTIKQLAAKLQNAKIRKNKLYSQLLAHNNVKMH